jgi:hypothetical protein
MDGMMTNEKIATLISLTAKRICIKNSPSMDTIRMQIALDVAFSTAEGELERQRLDLEEKLRALQRRITGTMANGATDFETLQKLHRDIFNFLKLQTYATVDAHSSEAEDRAKREVSAALESVFPRAGLVTFIGLPEEEKREQLRELALIVLGIRLFNRDPGGVAEAKTGTGTGLGEVLMNTAPEAAMLLDEVSRRAQDVEDLCVAYTDILQAHWHYNDVVKIETGEYHRLVEELANRRQMSAYLKSLQDDVAMMSQEVQHDCQRFEQVMTDVQGMIGGRSSVPKEAVYPKFELLAQIWLQLRGNRDQISARETTFLSLQPFNNSFVRFPRFDEVLAIARTSASGARPSSAHTDARAAELDSASSRAGSAGSAGGEVEVEVEVAAAVAEPAEAKEATKEDDAASPQALVGGAPVRLAVSDSSPEFLAMPFEYSGYCPVTVIDRRGLLLPGQPAAGVLRFRNRFYCFVDAEAMLKFELAPTKYMAAIVETARKAPQLIELLMLHSEFPALQRFMRSAALQPEHALLGLEAQPATKENGTMTPTHFVEQRIVPGYSWNEWDLRRRALQLASLANSATTSSQTVMSTARREVAQQTWLPKHTGVQTRRDQGTSAKRVTNYVAGLRGKPVHPFEDDDAGQDDDTKVGGTIDGETPDQRRARVAAERRKRATRPGRAKKTSASKFAIPARERGEAGPRSASVVQLSLDL